MFSICQTTSNLILGVIVQKAHNNANVNILFLNQTHFNLWINKYLTFNVVTAGNAHTSDWYV